MANIRASAAASEEPSLLHQLVLWDSTPLPLYYVNLERAKDRREAMEAFLAGVQHTRIPGISGEEARALQQRGVLSGHVSLIPNCTLKDHTGVEVCWKHHRKGEFTYNEAAVVVSHLRAIQSAYESGHEMALIFEDDVMFASNQSYTWQDAARDLSALVGQAPTGWQVLQLVTINPAVLTQLVAVQDPFVQWAPTHYSAAAYVINREGMGQLLDVFTVADRRSFSESQSERKFVLPRAHFVVDQFLYHDTASFTATRFVLNAQSKFSSLTQTTALQRALDVPSHELIAQNA